MDLLRDVRYAGRLLVKDRWFTVMAIVVLALGIGANNTVFTIVNGVLLRDLPLPNPKQIMFLGTRDAQGRDLGVSLRDFEDWRAATRTFSGMSFLFNGAFNVGNEGLIPIRSPAATSRRTSSRCSACHRRSGATLPRRRHAGHADWSC